jgi:hypothetical protein
MKENVGIVNIKTVTSAIVSTNVLDAFLDFTWI